MKIGQFIAATSIRRSLCQPYSEASALPLSNLADDLQLLNVVPNHMRVFRVHGRSSNGSTLSNLDEDGVSNDCYLWNASGQATPNFTEDVQYSTNQGQVHFAGSACNPLETCAPIVWDMRTVLNTPNPQQPTAYVNYNHTCYPSHQVKVNGQIIYLYTPPRNDGTYIFTCLALQSGKIIGQTSPVNVPNH